MKINNLEDVKKCRDGNLKNIDEANKELANTSPFCFKERAKIMQNIQTAENNIKILYYWLYSISRYNGHEFAKFINQILQLQYSDLDIYELNVPDKYTLNDRILREVNPNYKKNGHTCYYISDRESSHNIQRTVLDVRGLYKLLDKIKSGKQLKLNRNTPTSFTPIFFEALSEFPFDDDLYIWPELAAHPSIKEAIYHLLDLKIQNPEWSNNQCFAKTLEYIEEQIKLGKILKAETPKVKSKKRIFDF